MSTVHKNVNPCSSEAQKGSQQEAGHISSVYQTDSLSLFGLSVVTFPSSLFNETTCISESLI